MNALPPLPALLWPLLAACLLAFAVLWWRVLGRARFVRQRALRRRISAFGESASTPLEPALPGADRDAGYGVPLFLFLGDRSIDVPALLAAAGRSRRSMMAAGYRLAASPGHADPREHIRWLRTLMEFIRQRRRLPLNGIVVCVSASEALAGPRAIEATAAELRQRIDEATGQLRLHLPVYLLVTGLERLDGFDVVRAALPQEVLSQALGHRVPEMAAPGVAHGPVFDAQFDQIALRMHALRMALLRAQQAPASRRAIHAFVEQLRALKPALHVVSARLFDPAEAPPLPHWRGLYFAAATADTGTSAFVSDLFGHFLPADQPLARP